MAIFLSIQTRFLYLVDESTISATHKSHINASVQDACNDHNFDFNTLTQTLTLVAGVDNLNSDFNYAWGIDEGNAVNSDGVPLTRISSKDKYKYSDEDLVYWITWDNTNKIYVFNSKVQSGNIDIVYHFIPTDMSADGDVCLIPDGEAIALKAASKHFLGEDQDEKLKDLYEKEADKRLNRLYSNELNFGAKEYEYSKVSSNSSLMTKGN